MEVIFKISLITRSSSWWPVVRFLRNFLSVDRWIFLRYRGYLYYGSESEREGDAVLVYTIELYQQVPFLTCKAQF
jgi:hypothetical protein